MKICAVDPGPEKSAFVYWDSQDEKILQAETLPNPEALTLFRDLPQDCEAVVIEMIGHYGSGMPAGKEVFNTCVFIGELKEACFPKFQVYLIERRHIKIHLCDSMRAKDANIRQALIDRFGPPGIKKAPGKLYGIKADEWQALALAVCFADNHEGKNEKADFDRKGKERWPEARTVEFPNQDGGGMPSGCAGDPGEPAASDLLAQGRS